MTSSPDRIKALELVDEARQAGARQAAACAEIGIDTKTYRAWKQDAVGDRRPMAERPAQPHALTEAEQDEILEQCHRPKFASLPPAQIVTRLLDEEGRYIASESSFYRVLRAEDEQQRRGRAAAPRHVGPPRRHQATEPNELWSWDVTYLPSLVRGLFYYLYLIVDLYSRKIVGAEVFHGESAANSQQVIERALLREGIAHRPIILHGDNGPAMKAATLTARLEQLGVMPSYSRPRVSDDNAFSEALFRTCKYRPDYPPDGFTDIHVARDWVLGFVRWYNQEHRHSGIRFVTPHERHEGQDQVILEKRHAIYTAAKQANPRRWSGSTRNWAPVGAVWLNPEKTQEAA